VTAERAGSSGVVEVTYSSTSSEDVAVVLDAAVREALRVIAQSRVDMATAEADSARAAFDDASTELLAAQQDAQQVYTEFALIDEARRYRDTQDELGRALAEEDVASANRLQGQLDRIQNRLEALQGLRVYDARVTAALQSLTIAESRLSQAKGSLRAASTQDIAATEALRGSKLREAARRFLFVGAIGLVVAVALVVLLQLIDRRREHADADRDTRGGPIRRPAA
jgi:hypothetical protein